MIGGSVMQLNRRALAAGLGILLTLGGFAAPLRAEQVGADLGFGDGGAVTIDFAGGFDRTASLVLQPDGKVVVAGAAAIEDESDLVVVRLNPDGTRDSGFGEGGVARVDSGRWDGAEAIVLQPDGKIVAAGTVGDTPSLVRLNSDGFLDLTFGTDGIALIPATFVAALVLQADGRIVVAGYTLTDSIRRFDAVVSRFLPSGALDTSFGIGGSTVLDTGSSAVETHEESLRAVTVLDDGSLFAIGRNMLALGSTPPSETLLVRLTPDGDLDAGFNGTGYRLYAPTADHSEGRDVLADSAGRAVVSMFPSMLARFLPNGALDPTFGSSGQITEPPSNGPASSVLARDGSGRIVAAGGWRTYLVKRFTADGQADPSFGGGGFETKIGGNDVTTGIAVQPDGRLILASWALDTPDGSTPGSGTDADWTVLRLNISPDPPPSPPTPAGDQPGYWMLRRDGAVHSFGAARRFGDAPLGPGREAVDLEPVPDHEGYWIVDNAGAVFAYGHAHWLGGNPALAAGETVTSLSATPNGNGYWLFTSAGRVHPYGTAQSFGDMTGTRLNGPVLDSVPTRSGNGYYMVGSDGGIFAFGDAVFHGSLGNLKLNAPVQSLVPDPAGGGYWLVASDGGVFAFGGAPFRGSLGSMKLNKPITGMVPFGNGYLMVGEDGGIFNFSDRDFLGSLGANPPSSPVIAVAAR
jgi:uncharacterized delta-60 repeat protein